MLNHDFTVIGISETWLNDDDSDLYSLSGYKVIGHHRVDRAGGGVAVCVQEHVYFKERPDLSYFDEDCETVFIEIEKGHLLQNHNVIIGSQSSKQLIKFGVPQGSILGPLLFLIYINDLCFVCKNTEPVLFADDTNLFSSGSSAIVLQDGVNNDFAIIAEWLNVNKLSSNIKKTHFMCFSAKNKASPCISLQIDGEAIAENF